MRLAKAASLCASGWRRPTQAIAYREAILRAGGKGLLMTTWSPCRKRNRRLLLDGIAAMGPIDRGEV